MNDKKRTKEKHLNTFKNHFQQQLASRIRPQGAFNQNIIIYFIYIWRWSYQFCHLTSMIAYLISNMSYLFLFFRYFLFCLTSNLVIKLVVFAIILNEEKIIGISFAP